MAKRKADDYGSSRPKVTPDDLEEDIAILTIVKVEEVTVDDKDMPEGKRKALTLQFEELGDKVLWLNKTQVDYLIKELGDDDDDWKGQQIPVEKHESQFGRNTYEKVWVCAPEAWDEILEEAGIARKKAKPRRAVKKGRR